MRKISVFLTPVFESVRHLMPIIIAVTFFQLVILQQPLPNLLGVLTGALFVVFGLTLFLCGLDLGLFPIGESLAHDFARKGSVSWLVFFAFALGFGTTVAEPALIAVSTEAAVVAAEDSVIENTDAARAAYAIGLRLTVAAVALQWWDYKWVFLFAAMIGFSTTVAEPALIAVAKKANQVSGGAISMPGLRMAVATGVAIGIALGCFRIITGTPLHYYIIAGYVIVIIQTVFAPRLIIALAYDSGGVTTGTVTVPLVTALGLGLAGTVPGRSVIIDGFGLIAFASLFPIMAVIGYAQLAEWWARQTSPTRSSDDVLTQARRLSAHKTTIPKDRKNEDR